MPKPFILVILDGWGVNTSHSNNAIAQANTPQWDEWWQTKPHCLLNASGHCVGLPKAQMGNSEVGHMHIGAGRVIEQDFTRINKAIASGHFSLNPSFIDAINQAKQTKKAIHVMGLLSPGGVHSHQAHLFALINLFNEQNFDNAFIHAFLDGRDTPPKSAGQSLRALESLLADMPSAQLKSVTGRYYAMDRDNRWERVQPVYDMLTLGSSDNQAFSGEAALAMAYANDLSDEFVPPTLVGEAKPIEDGDIILFFNFRADRARQLSKALMAADFDGFERTQVPIIDLVTMTQYDKQSEAKVAFPPPQLKNTLGEVIANHQMSQLRVAETEKYAHVTFFLNGGNEVIFDHEDRVLIPSPKVATYDLKPEMSAKRVTNVIIESIYNKDHDVIICNFANPDMVGHTGNLKATIQAIECIDECLSRIAKAIDEEGGELLITADHGNAESMYDDTTQQAHTAHTTYPVPFLYVGRNAKSISDRGTLIDVAPSLLHLLGLAVPQEMEGQPLFELNDD